MCTRLPRFIMLACLLSFWANGLANLDRYPKVHEDEAWTAAPGYTFWERGTFSTDLFAGFYGMERHYYGFMPLFSISLGSALHLFGMGLFQIRLVPLILITLTLPLTYRMGTHLFSEWHGALAVVMLTFWQVALPAEFRPFGIPLADIARIARYDSAIPCLGLTAILLLLLALNKYDLKRFFFAGMFIGLAFISHLYGGFWLAVVMILLVSRLSWRCIRPMFWLWAGFLICLLPYILFVLSGWSDYVHQNRNYADRFDVREFRFYTSNLSNEVHRYDLILNDAGTRIPTIAAVFLFVPGLARLIYCAKKGDFAAFCLLTMCATLVALFALLLRAKTFSYLGTVWPLYALIATCGYMFLWRLLRNILFRLILLALLVGVSLHGINAMLRVQNHAKDMTTYAAFTKSLAKVIPDGSRVLALQHYWLGLASSTTDYHSLLVPIFLTNPQYVETPVPFAKAVDGFDMDILIMDKTMLDFLASTQTTNAPYYYLGEQIRAYLEDKLLLGMITDKTYGQALIYRLR